MKQLKNELDTGNLNTYPVTVAKLRNLVSDQENKFEIEEMFKAGLEPYILEFLKDKFMHETLVQREAVWYTLNY